MSADEEWIARFARVSPVSRHTASTTRVVSAGPARTVLTVQDADGTPVFQTELGDVPGSGLAWSPVHPTLGYVAMAGGRPQAHLLDLSGHESSVRQLTDLPHGVDAGDLEWAPTGESILVTGRRVARAAPDEPFRATRRIWRMEGVGRIDDNVNDVCLVATTGALTWLGVTKSGVVGQPRWSPNGRSIACLVAFEDPTGRSLCPSLRVWSPETGTSRDLLGTDWGWIDAPRWFPDGEHVMITGAPHLPGHSLFAGRYDLWLVDMAGRARNLTEWLPGGAASQIQADTGFHWPTACHTTQVAADGRTVLFTAESAGRSYVASVDLETGAHTDHLVAADEASYALLDVDGVELLLLESAIDLPPRLVRTNPADMSNMDGSRTRTADIRHFRVPSKDGVAVDTWLVLPPDGEPPYPAVLKIHGGPYGSTGEVYHGDVAALVRRGYAVLFHNFRGSYGYGAEYSALITANWGVLGEPDHHAVLDHVIALGLVDPDRLGVLGHSHGGFAACWLVGRSDRFVAAVAEDPVTNFHSSAGTSDIGTWFCREFGVDNADATDELLDRSPLSRARRCATPVLLIQGEQDLRCPPEQSDQWYAALWETGCAVEMLRFPRSDHMGTISGSHGDRHQRIAAVVEWFERHLQNGSSAGK